MWRDSDNFGCRVLKYDILWISAFLKDHVTKTCWLSIMMWQNRDKRYYDITEQVMALMGKESNTWNRPDVRVLMDKMDWIIEEIA